MSKRERVERNPSQSETPEASRFNRNALALEYGGYVGVDRSEGETDDAYRERLSGILRAQGKIVEAHEAYTGRRYDDPEQGGPMGPVVGITGAVVMEFQGVRFHTDPARQVQDELTAGVIVTSPEDPTRALIRTFFDNFGVAGGMDIIETLRKSK